MFPYLLIFVNLHDSVSPTFSSLLRGFLVVHAKEGEKKSMAPVMVEARREAEEAPSFRRVVVGGGSGFVGTELVSEGLCFMWETNVL